MVVPSAGRELDPLRDGRTSGGETGVPAKWLADGDDQPPLREATPTRRG
jgi:hypothetical protein